MSIQKPHIVRSQEESLISNVKKALPQPQDFPVMFYVCGIGGVGKSTLLYRLQENLDAHFKAIEQKIDFIKFSFSALDETPLGIMKALHRELPPLGILQKDLLGNSDPFADTLKKYQSTLNDLETKPIDDKKTVDKEQIDQVKQLSKLAANAGLWAGQTALSAGMSTPFSLLANSTTSAVVNNAVDAAIDVVTIALSLKDDLLLKHQATKQDQELRDLMLEPLPKLTQAFVESLVRHAKHIPVVLILDTYEKTSADVDAWLRQFLLTNKVLQGSKVRLVVAGRYHLFRREAWKELTLRSKLVQEFSLKEFEDKQTKSYLEQIGFSDKRELDKLWKKTKGLPFHLDLIRKEKQDGESINFTEEISDRLLKGLTEPQKRLVQLAACCRWFDRSLLESVVHCQGLAFATGVDSHRDCFDWLKGFDIVEPVKGNDGKYCLKDVARDVIRKSLFHDNRAKFREIHSLLQKYFEDEANRAVSPEYCESEKYTNPDWIRYTAEAIYHAFFNLSREDAKLYFLNHFFASRLFSQIEVVSIPFSAITSEFEISDNKLLPHENQKFLRSLESTNQYFFIVWDMLASHPANAIKVNEIDLSQAEIERIENTIKIFAALADNLPDGLAKYMGLASKFLRCRPFQKVELLNQLETQAEFLRNKIKAEYRSEISRSVGASFALLKKYEEAITYLNEAIELKPDFPPALANRGAAKIGLERYEEAIADLDEAIKLKPDFPEALYICGMAKMGLERYEEAITDFDETIRLQPDFSLALASRGISLTRLGQYDKALMDFNKAVQLASNNSQCTINRGVLFAWMGKYKEAIAACDTVLQNSSRDPDALYGKSCCYALQNNIEDAVKYLALAIAQKPDETKKRARQDPEFNGIREDSRFQELVNGE